MKIININCLTSNPTSHTLASISIIRNNHKFDIYFLIINFYCSYFLRCHFIYGTFFPLFFVNIRIFPLTRCRLKSSEKWARYWTWGGNHFPAVKNLVNIISQKHNHFDFITNSLMAKLWYDVQHVWWCFDALIKRKTLFEKRPFTLMTF